MKIILHGTDDLAGKVKAAELVMASHEVKEYSSRFVCARVDGKYYSVTFNKDSVTVRSNE